MHLKVGSQPAVKEVWQELNLFSKKNNINAALHYLMEMPGHP